MAQHVSNYSSGSIVITRNIETQDQQPQSLATLANGLKKAAGKLQGLDFSNASISTLSPSIRQFDQITVLNLSQNSLKVFPSVIWLHLKLLRSLDISSNQLREIPQEIFHLRSLETFNISNNNIVQLPNEIGCLFKSSSPPLPSSLFLPSSSPFILFILFLLFALDNKKKEKKTDNKR